MRQGARQGLGGYRGVGGIPNIAAYVGEGRDLFFVTTTTWTRTQKFDIPGLQAISMTHTSWCGLLLTCRDRMERLVKNVQQKQQQEQQQDKGQQQEQQQVRSGNAFSDSSTYKMKLKRLMFRLALTFSRQGPGLPPTISSKHLMLFPLDCSAHQQSERHFLPLFIPVNPHTHKLHWWDTGSSWNFAALIPPSSPYWEFFSAQAYVKLSFSSVFFFKTHDMQILSWGPAWAPGKGARSEPSILFYLFFSQLLRPMSVSLFSSIFFSCFTLICGIRFVKAHSAPFSMLSHPALCLFPLLLLTALSQPVLLSWVLLVSPPFYLNSFSLFSSSLFSVLESIPSVSLSASQVYAASLLSICFSPFRLTACEPCSVLSPARRKNQK